MATTYEHLLIERLQDITADTDPRVLFGRARMLAGTFEAAELSETHAALIASLDRLVVEAWVAERDGEPIDDASLCERMAAQVTKIALLIRISSEPHSDDPVALHPIPALVPPGTYGREPGEEPERLVTGD